MTNTSTSNICSIKPCPVCNTSMTVRKTSAAIDQGCRKWFFFLYCSHCGYGPNHAFDTIYQAVDHWNDTTLTNTTPIFDASMAMYQNKWLKHSARMFH